jgi:hypothetical protein
MFGNRTPLTASSGPPLGDPTRDICDGRRAVEVPAGHKRFGEPPDNDHDRRTVARNAHLRVSVFLVR